MVQFIQIILGCIIVLLGIITLKLFPMKDKVKNLSKAALLVVITLILKRLTLMVPLFGAESFKLGFEYIPLLVAGFLLGPSYGFLIGLCCDLIGLIIVPTGFPFLGFTLTMIMVAWIPGMVSVLTKSLDYKKVTYATIGILLMICIGAIAFVYQLKTISISSVVYEVDFTSRMILIVIASAVMILFGYILLRMAKRLNAKDSRIFPLWILSVILVELCCTLIMTPSWLAIMYGIPYGLSACVRIIKLVFVIPIEIMVGYIIVRNLYKRV